MTAASYGGKSISFRRVLGAAQSGPSRMVHLFKLRESHVEKTEEQEEDRCARIAVPEPTCCRCGCRRDRNLHRRSCGPRSASGASFFDLYGRPTCRCSMAEKPLHRNGTRPADQSQGGYHRQIAGGRLPT